MSEGKVIPKIFGKVHKKYKTPFVSIVIFPTIAILIAFSRALSLVSELYNFGALIVYMTVGMSLISLRKKEKNLFPPFETPWALKVKAFGKENDQNERYVIPVIGPATIIADMIIWISVGLLHPLGRTLGGLWMGFGLPLFFVYTRF